MRRLSVLGILAVCLVTSSTAVLGQTWPGYGRHRGGYGGYGGYGDDAGVMAVYSSAINSASMRSAAQSERAAGERAAAQQMAAMQGGIRSTLGTQAEARTQSLLSQQQSNRDWWFQVQEQQVAQRRAVAASSGLGAAAPVMGFESTPTTQAMPQAATDIIKWLPVLCEPPFAEQRARVEAPYRRGSGGLGTPTVADYKDMVDAAQQMKTILGKMTARISAQDYLGAEKFLDRLAAEANERIQKAGSVDEKPSK